MRRQLTVTVLFLALVFDTNAQRTGEKVYKKVNDAVVRIYSTLVTGETQSQGSGVLLADRGWLITNEHVLGTGNMMHAEHNGKYISLNKAILNDDLHDVIIVEINKDSLTRFDNKVPTIKLADSDRLRPGQRIYAIASPLGYENSISEGLISGLRKASDSDEDWIQFTAPVSPGSSGGGLFDEKGNLIGIINLQTSGKAQNLNFAIPINRILKLAEDKKNKKPLDYNSLIKSGMEYFRTNRLKQAHNAFGQAMSLLPHDSASLRRSLQYYSGYCDYNTNDIQGAITHFHRSKFSDTLRKDSYYYLGVSYGTQGDYISAKTYFEKAIKEDSQFILAYTSLANMYYNQKKYADASELLLKATAIDAKNYYVLKLKAYIGYATGDYINAQLTCYNILDRYPEDANIMLLLSRILIAQGHTENAFKWQQKAYKINPQLRYAAEE